MALLMQGIFSGIALGAVYALIALGFNVIFSTVRMGHFAQGEFFMFGGFVGFQFWVRWNFSLIPSIVIGVIATIILMLIIERIVYRPQYEKNMMGLLISTMGMQFIVQWIARVVWGSEAHRMPPLFGAETRVHVIPMFGDEVRLSHTDLMILLICSILVVCLWAFMKHTKIGVAMSAVSMNRRAAQLMGIKLATVIGATYIIAAGLAGFAGILMAPRYSVVFTIGIVTGVRAMTSAVMGGFGSMPGAILGGVIMGVVETLAAFYISTAYRDVFVFIVLIIILFWRPQGILGRKSIVKV